MDLQATPSAQGSKRRAGNLAQTRLKRRAVGHETGDVLANGPRNLVVRRIGDFEQVLIGFDISRSVRRTESGTVRRPVADGG